MSQKPFQIGVFKRHLLESKDTYAHRSNGQIQFLQLYNYFNIQMYNTYDRDELEIVLKNRLNSFWRHWDKQNEERNSKLSRK